MNPSIKKIFLSDIRHVFSYANIYVYCYVPKLPLPFHWPIKIWNRFELPFWHNFIVYSFVIILLWSSVCFLSYPMLLSKLTQRKIVDTRALINHSIKHDMEFSVALIMVKFYVWYWYVILNWFSITIFFRWTAKMRIFIYTLDTKTTSS